MKDEYRFYLDTSTNVFTCLYKIDTIYAKDKFNILDGYKKYSHEISQEEAKMISDMMAQYPKDADIRFVSGQILPEELLGLAATGRRAVYIP